MASFDPSHRERLADAYELRYKGEGSALSSALFGSYVMLLIGLIYGSITMNYVFGEWPPITQFVHQHPIITVALVIVVVLVLALAAFRLGATRGPALPEPGFIEAVVETDLPRALTLRDSWRGSQLLVICTCFGVATPIAIGLVMRDTSPAAIAIGVVVGIAGGILIVQSWLRGQVRGHGPIGGLHSRPLLESLPTGDLLTQSVMSESVASSLVTGDARRARTQAFNLHLRNKPERIRVAGPRMTMVWADVVGILRAGWVSVIWVIATIATVVAASVQTVVTADKPLVLPILYLLVHLAASGLTRGLQSHGMSAGTQSIFGIDWRTETTLHLLPLAVLQLVVALVAGLVSGLPADTAVLRAVAIVATMAGGQLLYAHKGPPPSGLMGTAPGRGIGIIWMAHPAIAVIAAALVAHFGDLPALVAGVVVVMIGYARAQNRFAPARLKESFMEQANREQEERRKAKAEAKAKRSSR